MKRLLLLVLVTFATVGSAISKPSSLEADTSDCRFMLDSRCEWIEAGAAPLAGLAARRIDVIRIRGSVGPSDNMALMFELRRNADGRPLATIRDPNRPAHAIEIAVSREFWTEFASRLAAFELQFSRERARSKARVAALAAQGREVVCLGEDGAALEIDAVDFGKISRFYAGACSGRSPDIFAAWLTRAFYALAPECLLIDASYRSFCPSISGDMRTAAGALPTIVDFNFDPCDGSSFAKYVNPDARVSLVQPSGTVERPISDVLKECSAERGYSFKIESIRADGGKLFVQGIAFGGWNEMIGVDAFIPHVMEASSVQVWRIDGNQARLESWKIEKFGTVD